MMRAQRPAGMRPPGVVLALGQQPREQVPDQARGGAQPVPLVVAPEQDLRHGQAGELGVGDVRRPSGPAAAGPAIRQSQCPPVLAAPGWRRRRGGGTAAGAGQRSLPALSQAM